MTDEKNIELLNPFDHNHFIGYVNFVSPGFVKIHFPSSVLLKMFNYGGEQHNPGMVGSYVAIEGESCGFVGSIIEVSLLEKERLKLNEKAFYNEDFHPIGKIEILLCFDFYKRKINKGLNQLPTIGSKVFICSGEMFADFFQNIGIKEGKLKPAVLDVGTLNLDQKTLVKISSQTLFGRHCAIIGTTGGGKSYTLAQLIEQILEHDGKAILIDPSGEFKKLNNNNTVQSVTFTENTFFHYSNLTIGDFFVLLRPAGQVQSPKLLEAIKSLKLVSAINENGGTIIGLNIQNDLLIKLSQQKQPFRDAYQRYIEKIETIDADFNINNLSNQIVNECVYESGYNNNYNIWGTQDTRAYENCTSLIVRLNTLLYNTSFKEALGFNKTKSDVSELRQVIENFYSDPSKNLLRISLQSVNFDFQLREVLVNAIGKYLLERARQKHFKEKPVVVFLDEAHQFLNKNVKDEFFDFVALDSFDLISKECRKYGLFLVLSTQMPRDIPLGTLSQIGTFITHRLINEKDKEVISNACQEANKTALSFLPILSEGEAVIMGVDIPMPIIVKIHKPKFEPDSETPVIVEKCIS